VVHPLPTATITPSGPIAICQGDIVTIDASGGMTYLWNNSATTSYILVNQAGSYYVTVTNVYNCSSTSNSADITIQTPLTINWINNDTVCYGDSLVLVASPPGGTFSGVGVLGNIFYTSASPFGLNTIYYNYFDGVCDAYSTLNINVIGCSSSIDWNEDGMKVLIYPNPAQDNISLSIPDALLNTSYQLIDNLGKVVMQGVCSQTHMVLDISFLAKGVYTLQLNNKSITSKLIKQ
jgi:hypothetical protein